MWADFFEPTEAKETLQVALKHPKRLTGLSSESKNAIEQLLKTTGDLAYALSVLSKLVPLGVVSPFAGLLRSKSAEAQRINVDPELIQTILAVESAEADALLRALVEISPSAIRAASTALSAETGAWSRRGLLTTIEILQEMPGCVPHDALPSMIDTAVGALADKSSASTTQLAARRILVDIARDQPSLIDSALKALPSSSFTSPLAALARDIASAAGLNAREVESATQSLVIHGLQYITRLCSSDADLGDDFFKSVENLGESAPQLLWR